MKFFIILALLCYSTVKADTKLSLMGSLLYNTSETDDLDDVDGIDEESGLGFGLGLRALMGINDQLSFRSGAGIIQKKFSYEVDDDTTGLKGDFDLSFIYMNIPLTLYWKASPQVGFFGGTAIQAKLSDDCDASGDFDECTIKNEKTLVLPAVIGFDFTFNEKFGMELSYEYGIMDTAKNVKVSSAVASVVYHLE